MDTRLTLRKRKFLMRHTMRTALHYSASRALDPIICKLYKLNRYALFPLCCVVICASTYVVLGNTLKLLALFT